MSGEEITPEDVGTVSDVLGEKIEEVKQGDYLYCEEDGQLYTFDAFEGNNIAVVRVDGSRRVYPFKGKGYTFVVVGAANVPRVKKDLARIKAAQNELKVTLMLLPKL